MDEISISASQVRRWDTPKISAVVSQMGRWKDIIGLVFFVTAGQSCWKVRQALIKIHCCGGTKYKFKGESIHSARCLKFGFSCFSSHLFSEDIGSVGVACGL